MAMDSFFISHGPPSLAIDEFNPATLFMKSWKQNVLPQRPKSILLISAHWETDVPTVNVVEHNETIYDFYGFPRSMYQLKYPAPGAPELAKKVKQLLLSSGFQRVKEDKTRGLDHGAWVPLMFMYPEANIPVCQLSLQTKMDGTYHYNLGKALAPLRDEGVLIIGSGSTTHNSRVPQILDGSIAPWAQQFDTWLKESLCNGRHQDVNEYDSKAPNGKIAHPTPDHFYPLHVALGAAGPTAKAELVHQSWDFWLRFINSFDLCPNKVKTVPYIEGGILCAADQEKDLMDTFFISHGSPAMSIDDSIPARHFLKSWQQTIITSKQQQPTAILVISAHWETSDPTLKYPAPSAPKLALRVKELLTQAGFPRVKEDKTRGLDHGIWVPLMLMYPEADIPVCQLSFQTELDGTHHYNMGKALAPLRDEGVLIIGSGNATHSLRALGRDEDPVPSWAFQFDTWLKESWLNGRYEDINHYEEKTPQPKMNHPSPEHFYPLHVALGAAGQTTKAQLIHHSWCEASLSYDSYRFSTSTAPHNNNA